MNQSKEEAQKSIKEQMQQLRKAVVSGSLPTDRQITKLAHTFYDRDKDRQIGADIEMMAVVRGIIQGMMLMRQLVEGNDR